ncbi:thiosulfate oxidation carrier complex protein SoxZ [Marinobacterium sp. YM272]|uniref:thiosulfate oxidation carrier complex protein SoxZ n=1 Tax=Marinobacterium sp. YM272 TaxID=3421654 RepID=UPI003D7F3725
MTFRMLKSCALALMLPGLAQADLPELSGNLQIPPAVQAAVEDSADLLIQVPGEVAADAPVPVRVRVLQSPVASLSLLSDAVDPVQLAQFDFQPGIRSRVDTRFMSADVDGVLVVVRTAAGRTYAGRRAFDRITHADALDTDEASAAAEEPEAALKLEARLLDDATEVTLRSVEPLVTRIQALSKSVPSNPVRQFELLRNGEPLVSAELDAVMWREPFFRFMVDGGKPGDRLTMNWVRADGQKGQLEGGLDAAPESE